MQEMPADAVSGIVGGLAVWVPILFVLIAALAVYLVLLARAIIDMLRHDAHAVLLTFAFLALIPLPLFVLMGILVLIIWYHHKKDILASERQAR